MGHMIVMGCQWGDEGKGKLVDILADRSDMVVRYQGGANAGHTIIVEDRKFVLHLIPSGILHAGKTNVIGNGCVVEPGELAEEINTLKALGIDVNPENLQLSDKAHIVTPIHKFVDKIRGGRIGTTGRGIGPSYADKIMRLGLRLEMLRDPAGFAKAYMTQAEYWLNVVGMSRDDFDIDESLAEVMKQADTILPFVKDTAMTISEFSAAGKTILFEGAQGSMLDIDHGTYPFVTSSNTSIGAAYTGSGVYLPFERRVAVMKAYTTRVGNGPFPTEQENQIGDFLSRRGCEFGATTGRARRCGWLDLNLVRKARIASGYTEVVITKLDVLSGLDEILVATGEDEEGKPVYEEFEGWQEDISSVTSFSDLPSPCRTYIESIENHLGGRGSMMSTSPRRRQLLRKVKQD